MNYRGTLRKDIQASPGNNSRYTGGHHERCQAKSRAGIGYTGNR